MCSSDLFRRRTDKARADDVKGEWISLDYAFKMEKGEALLPRPPIK